MASLTDNASPADGRIMLPVIRRHRASVHSDDNGFRRRHCRQAFLGQHGQRGEPAIEADHQMPVRLRGGCLGDGIYLCFRQAKWFLYKDVFAVAQPLQHHRGMGIVAGRDHDSVDIWCCEHAVCVGRDLPERMFRPIVRRRDAFGADNRVQARACIGECRDQHAPAIVSRANHRNRRHPACGFGRRYLGCDRARHFRRVRGGVFQQDAERAIQLVIGAGGLLQGHPVGQKSCHIQPPRCHQIQHRFEIALLGPADMANRVVLPTFLIGRVVATGAIGAGNLEGQFFLVEIRARQFQPRDADQHNPAPRARHLGGLSDGFVGVCGSSDQHGIDAPPAGERLRRGKDFRAIAGGNGLSAKRAGLCQTIRVQINAEHMTSLRAQHLYAHQSDEAQTDHRHAFAHGGRGQTDTLQADGTDDGEGGIGLRHTIGHFGNQIAPDSHDLGMGTIRGHDVARHQISDTGTCLDHLADIAVTQRDWLIELGLHCVHSRRQTVSLHLLDGLAHLVGLLTGLVDPVGLAKVQQHLFGTDRDQAGARADQHLPCPATGRGHIGHGDRAILEALDDLSHGLANAPLTTRAL